MKGYIHSIETFGTVDGPGVRYVLFLQGCPLRCRYCHNPDTWKTEGGRAMSAEEILREYESYEPYLRDGGITCTGGEPLLQIDFVTELFQKAKERGIHTCLDTSGITFMPENSQRMEKFDRLLEFTDLFMLDIKHIDAKSHEWLTGADNKNILEFAHYLDWKEKEIWIRHVIVPGITYEDELLHRLGYFLGGLKNIKALDILPYHVMGRKKYEELGLEYPLEGVPPLGIKEAEHAKKTVIAGMRERLLEEKAKKAV
ncbi:MAG: pyruvate formate-lyase-activating protein [Johnsonella sp.]|nr:pyruvate formate-lyase-activating protein [Johnsonella sp.]